MKISRKTLHAATDRTYRTLREHGSCRDEADRVALGTVESMKSALVRLRTLRAERMHYLVSAADLADADQAIDRAADTILE